jgi:hypothetical protein
MASRTKLSQRVRTNQREINFRPKPPERVDTANQPSVRRRNDLKQINFQAPAEELPPAATRAVEAQPPASPENKALQLDMANDPCAAMGAKPLAALGIGIAQPDGAFPNDYASACWSQVNASLGPAAGLRCWSSYVYSWDATCLCYRPLYFEEINLERHGYGCCEPLQPFASAAHFFGTIPALPYCMAVECPCECVYTLGHYRPGSCPPWRHHWPPCSPLAAAAEGGVWTGMIFLIP